MAKPLKMVVEAPQARIKPEEILYLVTEMGKRHEAGESTDWSTQALILHSRGYSQSPGKAFAIVQRIRCLARMMKDKRMRGWTMDIPDDPDCILTNEAVFRATAMATLHTAGRDLKFDADEFFNIALSETDAEGNA